MKRFFLFLLAALVAVVGCWEAYTLSKMPGTSREVRFFGYGSRPDVCVARVESNLDNIIGPMNEVARVFADDPTLAEVFLLGEEPDNLVAVRFTGEVEEIQDGGVYHIREYFHSSDEILDAEDLRQAIVEIAQSKNVMRPYTYVRTEPDGPFYARTFIECGGELWRWPFAFFLWVPPGGDAREGQAFGALTYRFGDREPELMACPDDVPKLGEGFRTVCQTHLSDGWVLEQDWNDRCSAVNEEGFDRESTFPGAQERIAEWIADGVTPCEAYLH